MSRKWFGDARINGSLPGGTERLCLPRDVLDNTLTVWPAIALFAKGFAQIGSIIQVGHKGTEAIQDADFASEDGERETTMTLPNEARR